MKQITVNLREAQHTPLKSDTTVTEEVTVPRKVQTTRAITVKKPVPPLSKREAQLAKKNGTTPKNEETKYETVEETVNDIKTVTKTVPAVQDAPTGGKILASMDYVES